MPAPAPVPGDGDKDIFKADGKIRIDLESKRASASRERPYRSVRSWYSGCVAMNSNVNGHFATTFASLEVADVVEHRRDASSIPSPFSCSAGSISVWVKTSSPRAAGLVVALADHPVAALEHVAVSARVRARRHRSRPCLDATALVAARSGGVRA